MNIREYWQAVGSIAATLPETVVLVSLANPEKGTTEGSITYCPRETAAQLIFSKTHRVASDAEVRAHQQREAKMRQQILDQEYERKQQFALPRELAALVEAAVKPKEK